MARSSIAENITAYCPKFLGPRVRAATRRNATRKPRRTAWLEASFTVPEAIDGDWSTLGAVPDGIANSDSTFVALIKSHCVGAINCDTPLRTEVALGRVLPAL